MVVPIYGHIDETEDVAEEDRRRFPQRAQADIMGRLQFEDHNRYDDGDHAITEGNKPILFHRSSFPPAFAYLAPTWSSDREAMRFGRGLRQGPSKRLAAARARGPARVNVAFTSAPAVSCALNNGHSGAMRNGGQSNLPDPSRMETDCRGRLSDRAGWTLPRDAGPDIGRRRVVASAERAIEVGEVGKAAVERDRGDRAFLEARVRQQSVRGALTSFKLPFSVRIEAMKPRARMAASRSPSQLAAGPLNLARSRTCCFRSGRLREGESGMSDGPRTHAAAMEGKGYYNRHAAIPASGGSLAIPLLESAAKQIELDSGDRPIVIADYGSSQGKNSLAPMRAAIAALRTRVGRQRPIFVCHTDLPANDFSEMFALLESDPESYLQDQAQVFPYAIGRSFYRSLFPSGYVDLGWSSYAAVWLSQIPRQIPDHFFIPCSTGAVRAEFDRQAGQDWEAFLALRAAELRAGGSSGCRAAWARSRREDGVHFDDGPGKRRTP